MDSLTRNKPLSGYSLLELIVTLAIIGITTSIALPSFSEMIQEHKSQQIIRMLYGVIQQSRHQAVSQNTNVVLCKSQDLVSCGGNWKDGIIAFADQDNNRSADDGEAIYRTIKSPFEDGKISWRSFGNKSHLEFLPSGRTNYQNGTFTYCTKDNDVKKARGISITVTGRSQIAFDRNDDGVRENSSGKQLRCN